MTTLVQQIEAMCRRMNELTSSEQELVRALGSALNRADDKLLQEVRTITAEHESRRGMILNELQMLAVRVGAFPAPREPAPAITGGYIGTPSYVPPPEPDTEPTLGRGDWRQAASNIEDELNFHLNGRTAAH